MYVLANHDAQFWISRTMHNISRKSNQRIKPAIISGHASRVKLALFSIFFANILFLAKEARWPIRSLCWSMRRCAIDGQAAIFRTFDLL